MTEKIQKNVKVIMERNEEIETIEFPDKELYFYIHWKDGLISKYEYKWIESVSNEE